MQGIVFPETVVARRQLRAGGGERGAGERQEEHEQCCSEAHFDRARRSGARRRSEAAEKGSEGVGWAAAGAGSAAAVRMDEDNTNGSRGATTASSLPREHLQRCAVI